MAKKKNSRKALAVVLGVVGVAGLGIASASQLTVTPTTEVAMGVSTAFTECDNAVGITYGYGAAPNYYINSVTITGIADACLNKALTFSIANVTTPGSPVASGPVTMSAWTTTAANNNSYTVAVTTTVPISADLGAATVIIG